MSGFLAVSNGDGTRGSHGQLEISLLDVHVQVLEHVASVLGMDPRDVKELNFLSAPEQVIVALLRACQLLV